MSLLRRIVPILWAATLAGWADLPVPEGMVRIPAGTYRPFFRSPPDVERVAVAAFALDRAPVTNGDFLRFVRAHPQWQRSQVKRLFAEENYLRSWAKDLEPGEGAPAGAPVTFVSWFAAKAYARWRGCRLPTDAEWEFAAATAGPEVIQLDPSPGPTAGSSGASPTLGRNPSGAVGVRPEKRWVWEWVADFNTAMVTGDARGDTGLDRQLFCGAGAQGARDPSDFAAFMRYGFRSSLKADYCIHNLGFRCARDL